jgi:hypothetical protein
MDDVDAVQAQIARNMLESGDWVTARLDGVAYLEKAPLIYWMMAAAYRIAGVQDWVARLPLALAVVLLCWVTFRFGRWAFGEEGGLYSGIVLATSVGLFLFTRILIPDAVLTLAITAAVWAWLRLLEPENQGPLTWSLLLGASLGIGLLLKGLIAIVFPVMAGVAYMAVTRRFFDSASWRRLRLGVVSVVAFLIAAPWHVLATLHNPPYFSFSLQSGPGQYRGFFWFYFMNEHVLRFLNLRYPHDYNTVPRILFWTLNLVWIFPWSAYLLAVPGLSYNTQTRASRTRLMAGCWIAVVMLFFTFSTTQEYYSMPIYPALALLAGSGLASGSRWIRAGTRLLTVLSAGLFLALVALLALVWRLPAPGDITQALAQNPDFYTLSLGHMGDLTVPSFTYLKFPLAVAAVAFGSCALGLAVWGRVVRRAVLITAASMIVFLQAARLALIRFDSDLGSYPLAQSLLQSPPGQLIEADTYYAFSSVFFYTNRSALLWNGRIYNLEYGSYAPGAPNVFIDDHQLVSLWLAPARCYLLAYGTDRTRLEELVGRGFLQVVATDGGNFLFTNHPLP